MKRQASRTPPKSGMSPGRLLDGSGLATSTVEANDSMKDVVVVGAGPAGLMLAANLVRFGLDIQVLDDRPDKTSTGRADGLQPKSIETLRQMRLADPLLQKGVRIYDICFWSSSPGKTLRRTGREIHYPPVIDVLDPYILLVHQGMVEELFLDDMAKRGSEVLRNSSFVKYETSKQTSGLPSVHVEYQDVPSGGLRSMATSFLVGTDGAHSKVRKSMSGVEAVGRGSEAIWGVLDGVIATDFPDLWSKVVIHSETDGSVLCIPRERNMTRLYIELRSEDGEAVSKAKLTQEFVMQRANQIMQPYKVSWATIEWFGIYKVGQRVASAFSDEHNMVFIAGDASHTHSPKAAQGMNTSMHDSWNLSWKLNLAVRGLARPSLLLTYEDERRKIAQDLISFDFEHANAFAAGDPIALAKNFDQNIAFISGVGVRYHGNCLNIPMSSKDLARGGGIKPGCLLPPAKVTRYIDANPVDIQLDVPMLGQFRIYIFVADVQRAKSFLDTVCSSITNPESFLGRVTSAAERSQALRKPIATEEDAFTQPGRYIPASPLFTYALVTSCTKDSVEIIDLPDLLQKSRWTFYLDNCPERDTRRQTCTEKWLGHLGPEEVALVNVRPDGYAGSVRSWNVDEADAGAEAAVWLEEYYSAFLSA